MKRLLVTGATGFIGRYCLPLLAGLDYEVHAVSSKPQSDRPVVVRWHQADLLNDVAVERLLGDVQPTQLLHLAWYTVPGKYWSSAENLRWVQASLGLLRAFALNGGKRAVLAGTCAEYDWRYGFCSEQLTPLVPATLYGACKHSLQLMLAGFAKQTGLSAAWGRIFFLYGAYEHPDRLVAYVIRSLLQGEPARCTSGTQLRDFLYVEDVASAFVALLQSEIEGAVNIGSGRPVAIREIVTQIGRQIGRTDLLHLGALPTGASEPPLLLADVQRLHEQVGWAPQFDLDRGLARTIDRWMKQLPSIPQASG